MEDRISTLYKRKVLVKSVLSDLPEPQASKGRDGYCIKSGRPPGCPGMNFKAKLTLGLPSAMSPSALSSGPKGSGRMEPRVEGRAM